MFPFCSCKWGDEVDTDNQFPIEQKKDDKVILPEFKAPPMKDAAGNGADSAVAAIPAEAEGEAHPQGAVKENQKFVFDGEKYPELHGQICIARKAADEQSVRVMVYFEHIGKLKWVSRHRLRVYEE